MPISILEQSIESMKYILLLGFCLLTFKTSIAQVEVDEDPLDQAFWVGLEYASNGLGMSFNYLRGQKALQWGVSVDFSWARDERELNIPSAFGDQGSEYIYGKINHLFILSPTAGIQANLFPNTSSNHIEFNLAAKAGPAIALLNPYYVEIFEPVPNNPLFGMRETRAFDPEVHSYDDVIGKAGLFGGPFSPEAKIGLSLRLLGVMDFSKSSRYIGGIIMGINADLFPERLTVMVERDGLENHQAFISFRIGLVLGNRW